MRLLVGERANGSLFHLEELAVVVDRVALGPEALHDADGFVHDGVAVVVRVEQPLGGFFRPSRAGDKVDEDAPLGELVEGSHHLRHRCGLDVAGTRRHQHRQLLGLGGDHRAGDPCLVAEGLHGHEGVFEARFLRRPGDSDEMLERRRVGFFGHAERTGITGGGDKPAKAEAAFRRHQTRSSRIASPWPVPEQMAATA